MTVDPKDANAILAKYNTLHDIFDCTERLRNDPPLLAHYTSIEVIEKIIKNEEIWLSLPFYMNDLSELRFGMLQGIQVFPAYALPAVATQERVRLILEAFNFYVGHMNEHTLVDTYVSVPLRTCTGQYQRCPVYVAQLRQPGSRRRSSHQHAQYP